MIAFILLITLSYVFLLLVFVIGFDRVNHFELKPIEPKTRFSIIIPFRNEAEKLPQLLQSLGNLDYPLELFEILMVDDDSEDSSVEIIKNSKVKLSLINNYRISNSPKKDAITTAIQKANNNWIITCDADCIVPKFWLKYYDAYIQENHVTMLCGSISYVAKNSFLYRFQQLELLSLMGATIGGFGMKKPFMCNGANLAYSKELFHQLDGFQGNSHIASGDDMFLLEKVIKYDPSKVGFLKAKEATVLTHSSSSFKNMIQQRVRWAAKSTHYKNMFGKLSGANIFIMNALIVSLFFLSFFKIVPFRVLLYCFVTKFYIDFWLILKTATFLDARKSLSSYLLSSLLYPFLTVFIVVNSVFNAYEWKGRRYKK